MRTIIAAAAALGLLLAVSAPTAAQMAAKPTAEQCKADPHMSGCGTGKGLTKPNADQCKVNPALKGCDTDKKKKPAAPATTAPAPK